MSPTQINFVVPDGTAPGAASFLVANGSTTQTPTGTIQPVAPTLFSINGAGNGVAAATAILTQAANPQLQFPVLVFQCTNSGCTSVPIRLGVDTPVYLTLYGTGIRNRSSLANVMVTINGISVPVLYAGPTPNFTGLDQVNVGFDAHPARQWRVKHSSHGGREELLTSSQLIFNENDQNFETGKTLGVGSHALLRDLESKTTRRRISGNLEINLIQSY